MTIVEGCVKNLGSMGFVAAANFNKNQIFSSKTIQKQLFLPKNQ